MEEKIYQTRCGPIHYWISKKPDDPAALVFLPGLTADHRLFDKQIEYFPKNYSVFVWDAPGHAASWPFEMTFNLAEKAKLLDKILSLEGISSPIIEGQKMVGYVGQY